MYRVPISSCYGDDSEWIVAPFPSAFLPPLVKGVLESPTDLQARIPQLGRLQQLVSQLLLDRSDLVISHLLGRQLERLPAVERGQGGGVGPFPTSDVSVSVELAMRCMVGAEQSERAS